MSPAPRRPQKRKTVTASPGRPWLLALAGILLLTFGAYFPCLDNGFTNWDDPLFVHHNPLISNPDFWTVLTTPLANNYHPVTIWSLALNYKLTGLNPVSYHWLNLLLHLANTALVFVFVRRLTKDRFWTTVVTALFFGIHPMHVESVAWIAERKDVVYAFFYLLGMIAYLRYLDRKTPVLLGATFLAFVLSVASKPSAVVFPLTLFAIDFYRRRPVDKGLVLEKAPFFAVALAAGLLTVHAQRITGAIDTQTWAPTFQKVIFAAYGIMMYVVKLFAPLGLSAIYPYPIVGHPLGWEYFLALGILVIVLPAIVFLCRRNRAVLFGIAFFFINILLVLQFFTVGQAIMADRYTYLPYIGLFFAFAWWLDEDLASRAVGKRLQSFLAAAFVLLAPVALVQTWKRCDVWQNSETLWNETIRRYPHRIPDSYYNRGHYYYQEAKRFDAALADFNEALSIDPKVAKTWVIKGNLFVDQGKPDSALACFDAAVRLEPKLESGWNNRSVVRFRMGDLAGALSDVQRAVALNPNYRDAYTNLALVTGSMKEYEKSIAASRRAIELDPSHPETHLSYGSIGVGLEQLKRYREAITALDEAIHLALRGGKNPGGYFLLRSYAYMALDERVRAFNDAQEALRYGATVDPAYLKMFGSPAGHIEGGGSSPMRRK